MLEKQTILSEVKNAVVVEVNATERTVTFDVDNNYTATESWDRLSEIPKIGDKFVFKHRIVAVEDTYSMDSDFVKSVLNSNFDVSSIMPWEQKTLEPYIKGSVGN